MASGWKSYSADTSSIKPLAQFAFQAGQEPGISEPRIWRKTQGKNVLWVDGSSEFGLGEVVHYSSDRQDASMENMMKKLRQFVEADAQRVPSERIDSVLWFVYDSDKPTEKMWQVLDGLSPKHLELFTSWNEDCRIEPLNNLKHQWNDLESLTLRSISNPNFMERSPNVLSQISSLTLDHCCCKSNFPRNLTNLKHLCILENDACDNFVHAVDTIPNVTQVLEVLDIESTNGCDFTDIYEPHEFRDRLRRCTNLRDFWFAAGYPDSLDIDLASYIPPSVERLSLRFTRSLPFLHDIDDWTKHAFERTWLPHLKSFQLTIDPESRVGGLEGDARSIHWTKILENPPREFSPELFDMEFERKRGVLYDVLKSTRPFIDLLT